MSASVQAKLCLIAIVWGCFGLLYLASVRDQSVIDHVPDEAPVEHAIDCVEQLVTLGKPYVVAIESCAAMSPLTPGELEVALP